MKNIIKQIAIISFLLTIAFINCQTVSARFYSKNDFFDRRYQMYRIKREDERKIKKAREYFNTHAEYFKNAKSFPAIYLHGKIVPL